jgi:hypothetical protein
MKIKLNVLQLKEIGGYYPNIFEGHIATNFLLEAVIS